MKFFTWLLTLIVLVLAVCFALNNRQNTTLNLWPAGIVVEAPLYLFSLGTLFAGILVGAMIGWVGHIPHRLEMRRLRREAGKLRGKIDDLNAAATASAARDLTPPLKRDGFFRRINS